MKFIKIFVVAVLLLGLAACVAVVPNFAVKKDFWADKRKVIGIAIVESKEDPVVAKTHKAGAQGLLDIAINNSNASELDAHLKTLDLSDVNKLAENLQKHLVSKGYTVQNINTKLHYEDYAERETTEQDGKHFAQHDYSSLKEKYGIDKLLLIKITQVGTIRSYYGFIPTSDPRAIASLNGSIINLADHQLEWNYTVSNTVPSTEKEWDTPPAFPGLSNAFKLAYNQSINSMFSSFAQ